MASTTAVAETADPKPKNSNKIRKRAAKACLSCRARKVRCDVSQRGRPCMNCYLDSETCVVTGRASRFRRQRDTNENAQVSYPPYPQEIRTNPTAEEVVKSRSIGQPVPDSTNNVPTPDNHSHGHRHDSAIAPSPQTSAGAPTPQSTSRPTQASQPPQYIAPSVQSGVPTQHLSPSTSTDPWMAQQLPQLTYDIVYSYYPFLNISNLTHILPQDVNYLESQGCFRVPTRAVLDEFVQQYFLHVHPLLPLLNEGDFWDVYCQQGQFGFVPQHRISLLVFQSMLFATCNFVSRDSIKALGYPSIRAARAAMYRRAKLLYDFESESSPICIAQAALLLSFWSPVSSSGIRKANSTWLTVAIQHAKVAEAHHYSSFGSTPTSSGIGGNDGSHKSPTATQLKRQNMLKRLWWCCIIRDRVLALCVRRSIQITRAHFDLDANSPLGSADLADEIGRSKVYNADTKRALIDIMSQLIDLCVLFTDMLILVYPLDDTPGWGRPMNPEDQGRVKEGKMALRRWYKGATLKFPMFGGGAARASDVAGGSGRREFRHDSVILYTNLMYMYYHSGRVALCHHEVLHLALAAPSTQGAVDSSVRDVSIIYENRHELQDAASGVTECLKELIQLRLARWLPISAVACTALPLVLHILDVKLSSPRAGTANTDAQNSQSALKQHRLNVLIEAMKTYQPQYDGVDWVSETIRHIVNLAHLDGVQPNASEGGNLASNNDDAGDRSNGNAKIQDWTDILTSHPSLYLRLALTMDLSLSKDRLPEEGDFPASLRGLLTGASAQQPMRVLLAANRQQLAQKQQLQQQHLRPVPGSMSSLPPHLQGQRQGGAEQQPRGVAPLHTMKQWLETDRALNYGIASGIHMDLDEPQPGGLPAGAGYSDSETGSQESYDCSSTDEHHHDQLKGEAEQQQQQEEEQQESFFQPFTAEEMEVLESHVLDAFTLQNESPHSSDGVVEHAIEIFGEALGADALGGWFQQTRKGEGGALGGEKEDVETARVLMDALREQEVGA